MRLTHSSQIQEHLPPGIALVSADNFETWAMDIKVLDDNPIYRDETYRLKFVFSSSYPIGALPASLAGPLHARAHDCSIHVP